MPLPLQWIAVGLGVGYLFVNGTITWRGALGFTTLAAGGLAFLLYKYQEHLLYQPRIFPQHLTPKDNPPGMREPGEHNMEWEDVRLTSSDGTKLHAWLIRPESLTKRRDQPTLLFFHENAGNMGLRMENLKWMHDRLNVNIMILSYRGYGESEGTAEEEGIYRDGEAAYQYLLHRSDIDTSRIVLFGRSLGGGVALDVAAKHANDEGPHNIACVIVENTFSSISSMVDVVFPFLSFAKHVILRLKWDSETKIPKIKQPILFLSGAQDEIVPSSQMATLHTSATSSTQKELVIFPNGKHNDTWKEGGDEYWKKMKEFLAKYAGPRGGLTQRASL